MSRKVGRHWGMRRPAVNQSCWQADCLHTCMLASTAGVPLLLLARGLPPPQSACLRFGAPEKSSWKRTASGVVALRTGPCTPTTAASTSLRGTAFLSATSASRRRKPSNDSLQGGGQHGQVIWVQA